MSCNIVGRGDSLTKKNIYITKNTIKKSCSFFYNIDMQKPMISPHFPRQHQHINLQVNDIKHLKGNNLDIMTTIKEFSLNKNNSIQSHYLNPSLQINAENIQKPEGQGQDVVTMTINFQESVVPVGSYVVHTWRQAYCACCHYYNHPTVK